MPVCRALALNSRAVAAERHAPTRKLRRSVRHRRSGSRQVLGLQAKINTLVLASHNASKQKLLCSARNGGGYLRSYKCTVTA